MKLKRSKKAGLLKKFPPGFDVTDLPELSEPLYRNCFIFTNTFLNSLRKCMSERLFNENLSKAVHKDLESVRKHIISTRCKVQEVKGAFEHTSLQKVALFLENFEIFLTSQLGKSFHRSDFHNDVKALSMWIDNFVKLKDSIVEPLEHLTEWPSAALSRSTMIIDTQRHIPTSARHTHFNTQEEPSPAMAKKIAENCKQAIHIYNLMVRYPVRQFRKILGWLCSSPCLSALRNKYAVKQATLNKAASLISTTYRFRLLRVQRDTLSMVEEFNERQRLLEYTDDVYESLYKVQYDDNLIEFHPIFKPELQPLTDPENSTSDEEFSLDAVSNLEAAINILDADVAQEVENSIEKIAGWSDRDLYGRMHSAKLLAREERDHFLEEQTRELGEHDLPREAEISIQAVSEALKLYHRTVDEQHLLMLEVVMRVYAQTLRVLESFHSWAKEEGMAKGLTAVGTWIKVLKHEMLKLEYVERLPNVIFTVPKLYRTIELYVMKYLIHF